MLAMPCPQCGMPRDEALHNTTPCPVCAFVIEPHPAPQPPPVAESPVLPPVESLQKNRIPRNLAITFLLGIAVGALGVYTWQAVRTKKPAVAVAPIPAIPFEARTPKTAASQPTEQSPPATKPTPEIRVHELVNTSKSSGMEFVLIPAGEFTMGSWNNSEGRNLDELEHEVRITKVYYLGTYEVTQEQYRKIRGTNPSWFASTGAGKGRVGRLETERFPVEQVSWFDAIEFCNLLSEKDGFAPCYKLDDVTRDGDTITKASVTIVGIKGYRLPTEAEWEYACRARSKSRFEFGGVNTGKEANVKPGIVASGYGSAPAWQNLGRTMEVGSYPANQWKLSEMHGNVAEWCEDRYGKNYYHEAPFKDPTGPVEGIYRVVRGGSWMMQESYARSASRFYLTPGDRKEYVGFRVARTP